MAPTPARGQLPLPGCLAAEHTWGSGQSAVPGLRSLLRREHPGAIGCCGLSLPPPPRRGLGSALRAPQQAALSLLLLAERLCRWL